MFDKHVEVSVLLLNRLGLGEQFEGKAAKFKVSFYDGCVSYRFSFKTNLS